MSLNHSSQPLQKRFKRKCETDLTLNYSEFKRLRGARASNSPDTSGSSSTDHFSELDHPSKVVISTAVAPISNKATSKSTTWPSYQKKFHCHYEGCSKSFNRPARLADHIHTHTNTRPYVCPHLPCTKDFMRKSHLKHHIDSAHSDVREFVCNRKGCDKSFVTGTRLRRHLAAHEGREKYMCTVDGCEQTFRKHSTLQRHITADHEGQTSYVCEKIGDDGHICGAELETAGKLQVHEDRVHGGEKYWCTVCGVEDPEADAMTSTNPAIAFATYAALQVHNKEAHPPTCSECGYTCSRPRELRIHKDIQHGGQDISERQSHACTVDDCGRRFTRKSNLDTHLRTVHKGEKAFVCGTTDLSSSKRITGWDAKDACGKAYTTKCSLEEHVRTAHLGLEQKRKKEHQESRRRLRAQKLQDRGKKTEDMGEKEEDGANKKNTLAFSRLTGSAYAEDERRIIPCLQFGCAHRFMREYDLDVHLRSKHGLADFEIQSMRSRRDGHGLIGEEYRYSAQQANPGAPLPFNEKFNLTNGDNDVFGVTQRELGQNIERTPNQNEDFWLRDAAETEDGWELEEREMRELIDQEFEYGDQEHEDELMIDPALRS